MFVGPLSLSSRAAQRRRNDGPGSAAKCGVCHASVSSLTLDGWVAREQAKLQVTDDGAASGMLGMLDGIQRACMEIASVIRAAGASGTILLKGRGEVSVKELSNEIFKTALSNSGRVGVLAGSGDDSPVILEETTSNQFVAIFDALDGPSDVDLQGTIFGIFEENSSCLASDVASKVNQAELNCINSCLQPGANMKIAGCCLYGGSTTMVLASAISGVQSFTLDPATSTFILRKSNIQIPQAGRLYSVNQSRTHLWSPSVRAYVKLLSEGSAVRQPYSLRYAGSLVADVQRTLFFGGVFMYPGDKFNADGKLRLVSQCAPLAFIIEKAGGVALAGKTRILDILPSSIHQRCPLFLGSPLDLESLEALYEPFQFPGTSATFP